MKNSGLSQSDFHKSSENAERLIVLAHTGSTNDDLVTLARNDNDPAPHFTVVVTDNQTAGRGRLGRTWMSTSGKSLAVSVLIRATELFRTPETLGWLPLIAGLSMTRAVQLELQHLTAPSDEEFASEYPVATLKWPNDVLINGFKVSGILTEVLSDQRAVVVGAGVNLTLDEHDLPTLTSTSLLLASGQRPDPDRVLASYLAALRERVGRFIGKGGDAQSSGILEEAIEICRTLGASVRVDLPGDQALYGVAETLDPTGRLIVRDVTGAPHAVAAGDVTHLRLDA